MSETTTPTPRKVRSPSYPSIALRTAIERAEQLYENEHKHPAPVSTVLHHWGYSPKSGPGFATLASVKQFGLIDDIGRGDERRVKLSELGLRIVQDRRPDSTERAAAIRGVALHPFIYAELWKEFGASASDANLAHYLERQGFTRSAASDVVKGYREAVAYVEQQDAGSVGDGEDDTSTVKPEPPDPERHKPKTERRQAASMSYQIPLGDADIVVEFPYRPTEDDWNYFMNVLTAMKPRLVSTETREEAPEG